MDQQQWEPVVIHRRGGPGGGGRGAGRAAAAARRRGGDGSDAAAAVRFGAAKNPGHGSVDATKVEARAEEGDLHIVRVDRNLAQAIQKARTEKKLTQKQLAQLMNCKATLIADYEAGRAIPVPMILSRLDRALGVHLPRPGKKKGSKK
eukprot:TRINITY_DN32913_c0_g2_i1.p1 TRINITY_DN32913_c0_g2~~TRINITY_DN32913_c0_g2_i1.p1  ORF type:complete len:148 (-),score=36.82 TRINITY_DN32913_c0_g2_i1:358-801(-)